MSYDYLIVVPADPLFRPDAAHSEATVEALRRLRPQASDWLVDFEEAPKVCVCPDSFERAACPRALTKPSAFVHGDAFAGAACPRCGTNLREWWFEEMDRWWAREDRRDLAMATPCCGFETSLEELTRSLPIGYACFAIAASPSGGVLSPDELEQISEALGAPARSFRSLG